MSNQYGIYLHARPSTVNANGIFYVGKGTEDRSKWFYGRNPYHSNVVAKHGKENILVGKMDCSSEEIAFELEKGLIKCLRRMGVNLANMTDGGEGFSGGTHTEKSKLLISQAAKLRAPEIAARSKRVHTGRKRSALTVQKISLANTGKTHSESAKQKLREFRTGTRWMNLNGVDQQIKADKVNEYVDLGWVFGRVKY